MPPESRAGLWMDRLLDNRWNITQTCTLHTNPPCSAPQSHRQRLSAGAPITVYTERCPAVATPHLWSCPQIGYQTDAPFITALRCIQNSLPYSLAFLLLLVHLMLYCVTLYCSYVSCLMIYLVLGLMEAIYGHWFYDFLCTSTLVSDSLC